jgi:hypothetical protein
MKKIVNAYAWLRDRAEDAWSLLHGDPDFKPSNKDPRNGL